MKSTCYRAGGANRGGDARDGARQLPRGGDQQRPAMPEMNQLPALLDQNSISLIKISLMLQLPFERNKI